MFDRAFDVKVFQNCGIATTADEAKRWIATKTLLFNECDQILMWEREPGMLRNSK
jgi:hypothetical protein